MAEILDLLSLTNLFTSFRFGFLSAADFLLWKLELDGLSENGPKSKQIYRNIFFKTKLGNPA